MFRLKSGSVGRMALGFLSILHFLRGRLCVGILSGHANDGAGSLVHAGDGAKERTERMVRLWPAVGYCGADKSGHTLDSSISVRMALFPERRTVAMALRVFDRGSVSEPNGCPVACPQLHRI